jgi:hypothetical protein
MHDCCCSFASHLSIQIFQETEVNHTACVWLLTFWNLAHVRQTVCLRVVTALPAFLHLQMPNAYQTVDQLYCVRALYIPKDPSNLNVS